MAQQGCSLSTLQIKQRFKHKIFASECTFGLYHCHILKKQIHPSENTTVLCIKEKQKKKQKEFANNSSKVYKSKFDTDKDEMCYALFEPNPFEDNEFQEMEKVVKNMVKYQYYPKMQTNVTAQLKYFVKLPMKIAKLEKRYKTN